MKRDELVVLEVVKLSAKGDGIAYLNDRELVIPRAVPGDRIEARLRRKRKGRWEADIEQFLSYGVERQPALCQHFGLCGGCRWQELAYEDQLRLKEQVVCNALEAKEFPLPSIAPMLGSPEPFFYRNKMEFSFGKDRQGNLQLGLHVRGRFNWLFDVQICHLQSELSNRIIDAVRRHAIVEELSVYDLKTHEGLLRFLVVREGKKSGEVMVNLVVSEYPNEVVDRLVEGVLREIPEITTFVVSLHQGKAQVAVGQEEFVCRGEGRIVEECGGVEYEISPCSFFQTNPIQAERLYRIVVDLAGDLSGMQVLDLYCGTGGISLHLARAARSVWGIELVEEAVEDARKNAVRNGIDNCIFSAGAVEKMLMDFEAERFDLAVVDPPRVGVHKRALAALGALRPPVIIYVSCNPITMADDLEVLYKAGYLSGQVQPVDMFPQTPHCEAVVRLTLVDGG